MKKRDYGIDLIKSAGVWMVIAVHFIAHTGFYDTILEGKYMFFTTILLTIFMSCVPLFLMVTGYLLHDKNFGEGHYTKISFFIVEAVFWVFWMTVLTAVVNKRGGVSRNIQLFAETLFLDPIYYIPLYFNLYLIAPLLNYSYSAVPEEYKNKFIIVVLFIISLPRFLNYNLRIQFFEYRYILAFPILYYFLGVHYRYVEKKIKNKFSTIFLIVIILVNSLIHALLTFYYLRGGYFHRIFGNYENIFYVINTVCIFTVLKKKSFSVGIKNKSISFLSKYSLAFYILNPGFSDKITRNFLPTNTNSYYKLIIIFIAPIISLLISSPFIYLLGKLLQWINNIMSDLLVKIRGTKQ